MAGQCRAAPAREQAEAIIQAGRDLVHGKHRHAGGRQLDGQGDPVEPPADLRDCGRVGGGERELGLPLPRPLNEQPLGI
jgi:hypothetical protein